MFSGCIVSVHTHKSKNVVTAKAGLQNRLESHGARLVHRGITKETTHIVFERSGRTIRNRKDDESAICELYRRLDNVSTA